MTHNDPAFTARYWQAAHMAEQGLGQPKQVNEKCPVCGQDDNCGDCNHYGTPHYKGNA